MRSLQLLIFLAPLVLQAQDAKKWQEVEDLYANGKIYAGLRKAEKYLTGKNGDPAFYILRAEGRNRIGEYWKAASDAREALRSGPDHRMAEACLQLGVALQETGHPDSARYWLERGAGGRRANDALLRLARMDVAQGDLQEAGKKLDRILQDRPDDVKALMERGAVRMRNNDVQGAKADLDKAVELAPRDASAWNARGFHLHATQDRHAEAIGDYDRAIKLDPNYSFAFNNRGWSYFKLGDIDKARRNIKLAGRKRPNNPYVHRNLGSIELAAGDTALACTHFRTAERLNFHQLHGDEVQRLIATHCKEGTAAPAQQKPEPAPTRSNAPRSNAPRSNAP